MAYDKVKRGPMLEAMTRLGITGKLHRLISLFHSNTVFRVKGLQGSISDIYEQVEGLRQGDPLACIIFNLLLTVIMKDARDMYSSECVVRGLLKWDALEKFCKRPFVAYADDTNLYSQCRKSVEVMLHCLQVKARKYGLELNIDKSFLILIGDARRREEMMGIQDVDGRDIQCVSSSPTLGFELGGTVRPVKIANAKASGMLQRMNQYKYIWQSNIPIKNKIQKYYSLIVSKAIWGLHLLALSPRALAHLEYIHVRCMRRILRIPASFISNVSNEEVLRRAKARPLRVDINLKQCSKLGHILRRDDDHPDFHIQFQNRDLDERRPDGCGRRVGRARTTWFQSILPLFTRHGHFAHELSDLAQDRDEWYKVSLYICANNSLVTSNLPALGDQ